MTNFGKIDANDLWLNGAYDERGDSVWCDICSEEMQWNPRKRNWYCTGCGQEMDRAQYFNHIGANPPDYYCRCCIENYPLCKRYCSHLAIDPDDPMLD